jgi:signal transduction histidine kinase
MLSNVGAPERLRAERLRAASTAFLRVRPLVAVFGIAANGALLVAGDAPTWQIRAVGLTLGTGLAAFVGESLALRRRWVTESWLLVSLALTVVVLALGCAWTGGLRSPMAPILAAPIVVALLAFGRGGRARIVLGVGALAIAVLLVAPALGPVPTLAAGIAAVSWAVTLALLWLAAIGLGDAHAHTATALDRMRIGAIEEAAARARETEALGAKVAHEMRNPLTAIKALVQLVARASKEQRDGERLGIVLGEIERVERTLSDYLSLARPLTDVAPEPIDLATIASDVAAVLEARAADAGVHIHVHAEPLRVLADPRRLREALLNLCMNAIEAMPNGGALELCVQREKDQALLVVRDQGVGLAPDVAARLGEPFTTTREGGTGLGVALARSVARMHGGELRIASTPGNGTTMTLVIPTGGPDGARAVGR